jgi:hypothetical protein
MEIIVLALPTTMEKIVSLPVATEKIHLTQMFVHLMVLVQNLIPAIV